MGLPRWKLRGRVEWACAASAVPCRGCRALPCAMFFMLGGPGDDVGVRPTVFKVRLGLCRHGETRIPRLARRCVAEVRPAVHDGFSCTNRCRDGAAIGTRWVVWRFQDFSNGVAGFGRSVEMEEG